MLSKCSSKNVDWIKWLEGKVDIRGEDDCWNWLGSIDTRGYGHLNVHGKTTRAHRYVYTLVYGEIPPGGGHHGTVVRHSCDNRICCNPRHLLTGSHADNMNDMKERQRRKGICICEANGRAVLTPEQVRAIRVDARAYRAVAKAYGVSYAAVQRIKSGKSWSAL